jgi:hypothetical protein
MKFNEDNIKKYLELMDSYKIFDIDYTQKEKESINNINIKKNKNYTATNIDKIKDFFKDIGCELSINDNSKRENLSSTNFISDNKDEDIQNIINIIQKLIDTLLKAYNVDSYWLIVRSSYNDPYFDIPRWHCDGYYFVDKDKSQLQTKFVTTLKGQNTLVLETTPEEKEYFYSLQNYKNTLDIENRKHIAKNIKGKQIDINNNQGIIFVAGDKNKCLIHSEPLHDRERIFISILPGSKKDIDDMLERMNIFNKKMDYLDKFNKAFEYPFSFLNKNNKHIDKEDEYVYKQYELKNIIKMMFNKNMKPEKMNINKFYFPKNIIEVFWFEKGIPDEKPWQFIGIAGYKNKKKFVYYIADSYYTGFDCQGNMKLYVSRSLRRLLRKAVPADLIEIKEIQELKKNTQIKKIHK